MRRVKTAQLRALEERVGRPAEEAIVEAINRTGSVPSAARDLDVNYWTLLRWIDRLRIEFQPERAVVPSAAVRVK